MEKIKKKTLLGYKDDTFLLLSVFVLYFFILTGCNTFDARNISGFITQKEVTTNHMPGDIHFLSIDGEQRSLAEVCQPISIIAFVSPDDHAGLQANPELVSLAHYFRNWYVSVVQISDTGNMSLKMNGLTEQKLDPYLIVLVDKNRIAYDIYSQPDPGTVLLMNEDGMIVTQGKLSELHQIYEKANQMIEEYFQGC